MWRAISQILLNLSAIQRVETWKCQECRNYGNPFRIPTITWKTLRVSHIPLQNPLGFEHSHISSLSFNKNTYLFIEKVKLSLDLLLNHVSQKRKCEKFLTLPNFWR